MTGDHKETPEAQPGDKVLQRDIFFAIKPPSLKDKDEDDYGGSESSKIAGYKSLGRECLGGKNI